MTFALDTITDIASLMAKYARVKRRSTHAYTTHCRGKGLGPARCVLNPTRILTAEKRQLSSIGRDIYLEH